MLTIQTSTRGTANVPCFGPIEVDGMRLEGVDGKSMRGDPLWQVTLTFGAPDRDRHGNDIGGDRVRGCGPTPQAALDALLAERGCRRTAIRVRAAQAKLAAAIRDGITFV